MWQMIRQFLNTKQYLYYIGRHDILPPPLKGQQEKEIIEKAVSGDQKARDLLIEHNLRLVVYVAKRYDNSANCPLEDLISIGTIGLVKAINTFKADKNIKLATYASRCIENEILMYLRKNNKIRYEISLDEPLNIDYDGNELLLGDIVGTDDDLVEQEMLKSDQKKIFYEALKELNEREKEMKKRNEGFDVKIIIDNNRVNKEKPSFTLEDHFEVYRVDVMSERYKNIMHRKFCVIDLEVAMHGTFNWTNAANYNKEHWVVDHNRESA